jgi:excisionase family DNA binding protein
MISIKTDGSKLYVESPYNIEFVKAARDLGGRWDGARKAWGFASKNEAHVRKLLTDCYGTTGDDDAELVTVKIDLAEYATTSGECYDNEIYFAGRVIAHRPGRDLRVKLGEDVIRVAGSFEGSAGSMKNPRIGVVTGVVLEVGGVPRAHSSAFDDGVTILEPTPAEVSAQPSEADLLAEREQLLARVAEIDALLPSPPAAEVTTRQAATALGVSVRTVQRWASQGKVQATKDARGCWVITITITAQS